jgi:hypothetical protein
MSYRLIPPEMLVAEYEPTTLRVACERCKLDAPELKVQALRKRFGSNLTIGQLALKVALSGRTPCGLAETGQCEHAPGSHRRGIGLTSTELGRGAGWLASTANVTVAGSKPPSPAQRS